MSYVLRTWSVPAELEEVVSAELWEAGSLGCQVVDGGEGPLLAGGPLSDHAASLEAAAGSRVVLAAVFPAGTGALPDPLADWLGRGVESLDAGELEDGDWLAAWRENSQPFDLGDRFRVDPREPGEVFSGEALTEAGQSAGELSDEARIEDALSLDPEGDGSRGGRRLLRLPARQAFGVGSHESTRLAVELLEDVPLPGLDVLDVGTGTGILAFVALDLGARSAVALDLDPTAVFAARDNARRNHCDLELFAGTVEALAERARFDWALVNIIPELILPALPGIATRVDGMVLSGILKEKGSLVLAALRPLGFERRARVEAGEWVAFRVERRVARLPPEARTGEAVLPPWVGEGSGSHRVPVPVPGHRAGGRPPAFAGHRAHAAGVRGGDPHC